MDRANYRSNPIGAHIVRPGGDGEQPYARLIDGREVPIGALVGQKFLKGTRGSAQYIRSNSLGYWSFTPK